MITAEIQNDIDSDTTGSSCLLFQVVFADVSEGESPREEFTRRRRLGRSQKSLDYASDKMVIPQRANIRLARPSEPPILSISISDDSSSDTPQLANLSTSPRNRQPSDIEGLPQALVIPDTVEKVSAEPLSPPTKTKSGSQKQHSSLRETELTERAGQTAKGSESPTLNSKRESYDHSESHKRSKSSRSTKSKSSSKHKSNSQSFPDTK